MYIRYAEVEWNERKAEANLRKHGVDFMDAVIALEDEFALTIEDIGFSERRFKSLAIGPEANVLMVVHSERAEDTVRIISARKASRRESRIYFEGIRL